MPRPRYPFQPRSNRYLVPGQFWAIELADGRFGCGRVLEVDPQNRVRFLAGLMDWCGNAQPTPESIAGSSLAELGKAHIKTIAHTGGAILGHRPLEADGVALPEVLDAWHGGHVVRGFTALRRASAIDEASLPVLGAWGYDYIRVLAARRCMARAKCNGQSVVLHQDHNRAVQP